MQYRRCNNGIPKREQTAPIQLRECNGALILGCARIDQLLEGDLAISGSPAKVLFLVGGQYSVSRLSQQGHGLLFSCHDCFESLVLVNTSKAAWIPKGHLSPNLLSVFRALRFGLSFGKFFLLDIDGILPGKGHNRRLCSSKSVPLSNAPFVENKAPPRREPSATFNDRSTVSKRVVDLFVLRTGRRLYIQMGYELGPLLPACGENTTSILP